MERALVIHEVECWSCERRFEFVGSSRHADDVIPWRCPCCKAPWTHGLTLDARATEVGRLWRR